MHTGEGMRLAVSLSLSNNLSSLFLSFFLSVKKEEISNKRERQQRQNTYITWREKKRATEKEREYERERENKKKRRTAKSSTHNVVSPQKLLLFVLKLSLTQSSKLQREAQNNAKSFSNLRKTSTLGSCWLAPTHSYL